MFHWYKEWPGQVDHHFRHPDRDWLPLSRVLFVDKRVTWRIHRMYIKDEANRITAAHDETITRIEVVPYQWDSDENFVSVGFACETEKDPLYLVYSCTPDGRVWNKLIPFEGLAAV